MAKPREPQANVRLTASEDEILRAVVFLEEKSASEVLRPVVVKFLAQQAKDANVQSALGALRDHRQKREPRPPTSIADRQTRRRGA